jgi:hypothetical protein
LKAVSDPAPGHPLADIFNEFQQVFACARRCDVARLKRTFAGQLID